MDVYYAPFAFVGMLNVLSASYETDYSCGDGFLPGLGRESALGLESKLIRR